MGCFWLSDFILNSTGVGETNYYYLIKLGNVVLFVFIWFAVFDVRISRDRGYCSIFLLMLVQS